MSQSYHELILWQEIEQAGFPLPIREHRFHPKRKWRIDQAWPDLMCGVEIEGGVWINGRHTRGKGFINDCEKYNEAALMGWTILRIPTDWVEDGSALPLVKRLLDTRLNATNQAGK